MRRHNESIIDKSAIGEELVSRRRAEFRAHESGRHNRSEGRQALVLTKTRPEPASAGGIMRGQEEYLSNANNRLFNTDIH